MTDAPPRDRRAAAYLAALILLAVGACSGPPSATTKPVEVSEGRPSEGPTVNVGALLQKDADIPACKGAVQLLESARDRLRVEPLSGAALEDLGKWARLEEADRGDIVRAEFSANSVDPYYLAESILMKDAARSLGVGHLPPREQARRGFEWVCRQVYLRSSRLPNVPVWYILERGSGTPVERAYVFVALLRQLGVDGCLIGPGEAWNQPSATAVAGGNKIILPTFWAVGARDGGEIYLFDPWSGRPLPAADGKGVATLRQARQDEALTASWAKTPAPIAPASPPDWKHAEVYLTAPLSGLAPRMSALEAALADTLGVRLRTDALAERDRLKGEAKRPSEPKFWNPPNDAFCLPRLLGGFLPIDQGGRDRNPPSARFLDLYVRDLVPWALMPRLPLQPGGMVNEFVAQEFQGRVLGPLRLTHGSPRDRLLRGQWTEATKSLMTLRTEYESIRSEIGTTPDLEQDVVRWCEEAERRFADFKRSERASDPAALEQARASMQDLLMRGSRPIVILFNREASKFINSDSTYLLALTVHEKAVRTQELAERQPTDSNRSAARAGWKNAQEWWERFLHNYPEAEPALRERFAHARRLLAECEQRRKANTSKT